MALTVKNPPEMQETWVRFMAWEDPLEKGMATHFSILTWRIARTEEPRELQFMGPQRVRYDQVTNTHTHTHTLYYNLKYFPDKNACLLDAKI